MQNNLTEQYDFDGNKMPITEMIIIDNRCIAVQQDLAGEPKSIIHQMTFGGDKNYKTEHLPFQVLNLMPGKRFALFNTESYDIRSLLPHGESYIYNDIV